MNQSLIRAHNQEEIKGEPFANQELTQGFSKKDKENAVLLIISIAIGGIGCILALIAELF